MADNIVLFTAERQSWGRGGNKGPAARKWKIKKVRALPERSSSHRPEGEKLIVCSSMRRFGERTLSSRLARELRAGLPRGSSFCSRFAFWYKPYESTISRTFNQISVTTADHIASLRCSHKENNSYSCNKIYSLMEWCDSEKNRLLGLTVSSF